MIQSAALLKDLKAQLKLVQADLRTRADDKADRWGDRLQEEYAEARRRERTGYSWVVWRDNEVDQAAVAWLIATTFVRFCEDNDLLSGARIDGQPVSVGWIAGPGDRTARAEENLTAYFRNNPTHNRRDWLRQAFRVLAAQPAGRALVDEQHNPVWIADISAECASGLVDFWRATNAAGELVHDFSDRSLDTRFLGDLYQDLSEHARKTYALLQTPVFVEEFILDQTLTPALAEFGLNGIKLIDPTCGSGHFLLGAFQRLVDQWQTDAPALDEKERVRRAMDSIHGVDLNPFAVAIARFRLTVAGLVAMGERSLVGVPNLGFHLAIGDSLLGETGGAPQPLQFEGEEAETFFYDGEDLKEYTGILKPGQYHVVLGNPPYIAPPDKATRALYRKSYKAIKGKYVLSVPFMELFFRLAVVGGSGQGAGYVGKITSNSFMKREFGARLIEWFFAGQDLGNPADLTAVIDSSGAWFPGHNFDGTPTVILCGRRRRPVTETVRAVYGLKGDATVLADPSEGPVWREIVANLDNPGYVGTYVAVDDAPRASFTSHPWSLSGGGVDEVMESLADAAVETVANKAKRLGFFGIIGYDDVFIAPPNFANRRELTDWYRPLVVGDEIRDFVIAPSDDCFFPYDDHHVLKSFDEADAVMRSLWPYRVDLQNRATYEGVSYFAKGRPWWEWHQLPKDSGTRPEAIAFAEVATHVHFAIDRSGRLFKQTAPVLKFSAETSDDDVTGLYAVLNSSVACFWLREVSYPKDKSKEPWETRHQFGSTKVGQFPLIANLPSDRGATLESLSVEMQSCSPESVVQSWCAEPEGSLAHLFEDMRGRWEVALARLVYEQEELDWDLYRRYGLVDVDLTAQGNLPDGLHPNGRAFEIALARRCAAGEETAYFDRHSRSPMVHVPPDWPESYRATVSARLAAIEASAAVGTLERPENKRRWQTTSWDDQLRVALEHQILERLERSDYWKDQQGPVALSVAELTNAVRKDDVLVSLANALTGSHDAELSRVLSSLVVKSGVPYLAAHRYKPSGLEKFREWQEVWSRQRMQDGGASVDVASPPKFNDKDFVKKEYWASRGSLDVPKERFILYPDLHREGDGSVVLGWAGWDHKDQALALAREFPVQDALGAGDELVTQMVAGLVELEPWVHQWHSEMDASFGVSPADAISGIIDQQLGRLEATRGEVTAWEPPAQTRGRRAKNS